MFTKSYLGRLVVVVGIFMVMTATLSFGSGERHPLSLKLDPINEPLEAGLVDLRLSVLSYWQWDTIAFEVTTFGDLEYIGEKSWSRMINKGDTIYYNVSVDIPPNDTSGIKFQPYKGSKIVSGVSLYFVTTGDTAETYPSKPKPPPPPPGKIYDTLNPNYGREYKTVIYDGKEIREGTEWQYGIVDTIESKYFGPITDGETKRKAPGKVKIGDVRDYQLDPSTFKYLVPPLKKGQDSTKWQMMKDFHEDPKKYREECENTAFDIVLDLRRKEDYEYVRKLFDLIPMEESGYYHTKIYRRQSFDLRKRGIGMARYPNIPGRPAKKNEPH